MIEKENAQHREFLARIRSAEERIDCWRQEVADLAEDGQEEQCTDCKPMLQRAHTLAIGDDKDLLDNEVYTIESTGAAFSYKSAVKIVHYFCAVSSPDQFSPSEPQFEFRNHGALFAATLTLPSFCPFQTVESKWMGSRIQAKRSAAFEAVKQLIRFKQLDEHLLPVVTRNKERNDYEGMFILLSHEMIIGFEHLLEGMALDDDDIPRKGMQRDRDWHLRLPWSSEEKTCWDEVFCYTLDLVLCPGQFDNYATLCLLSPTPLPDIPPFNLYVPDKDSKFAS
jgi:hypothetical protein